MPIFCLWAAASFGDGKLLLGRRPGPGARQTMTRVDAGQSVWWRGVGGGTGCRHDLRRHCGGERRQRPQRLPVPYKYRQQTRRSEGRVRRDSHRVRSFRSTAAPRDRSCAPAAPIRRGGSRALAPLAPAPRTPPAGRSGRRAGVDARAQVLAERQDVAAGVAQVGHGLPHLRRLLAQAQHQAALRQHVRPLRLRLPQQLQRALVDRLRAARCGRGAARSPRCG